MKYTETDLNLFKALQNSQTGAHLSDLLGRMIQDSGFLPENLDNAKGKIEVLRELKRVIDKTDDKKESNPNQYFH